MSEAWQVITKITQNAYHGYVFYNAVHQSFYGLEVRPNYNIPHTFVATL